MSLVAVLSGPERTRAKAEIALEDAHLPILPPGHHSLGCKYETGEWRKSYAASEFAGFLTPHPSGVEQDEEHGFVAVVPDAADALNRAASVVESHGWVLRTHRTMPDEPKPDPLAVVLTELYDRIAHLESQLKHPPMRGGAVETPPWATQSGSFGAEQTRRAIFSAYARTSANSPGKNSGGLLSATDCQISAPVSGLSANISTGELILPGNEGGTQGAYYGYVSSTTNLTISTANPSNPRIDTICGTVFDSAYTTPSPVNGISSGNWGLQVVTGTATSGATLSNLNGAATLPGSSLLLGYVLVPAAATNIVSGDIANVAASVHLQQFPDTGWVALTLGTNWGTVAGNYVPAYRALGTNLLLRGTAQNNNTGASNVALQGPGPSAMYPAKNVNIPFTIFTGSGFSGTAMLAVGSTGISGFSGTTAAASGFASFDGCSYSLSG